MIDCRSPDGRVTFPTRETQPYLEPITVTFDFTLSSRWGLNLSVHNESHWCQLVHEMHASPKAMAACRHG